MVSAEKFVVREMGTTQSSVETVETTHSGPSGTVSYEGMIIESVSQDPFGQSFDTIAQYVKSNYDVEDDYQIHVRDALKKLERESVIVRDPQSGLYKLTALEQPLRADPTQFSSVAEI